MSVEKGNIEMNDVTNIFLFQNKNSDFSQRYLYFLTSV